MHPDKSPGPNGMNPAFFQRCCTLWDMMYAKSVCFLYLRAHSPPGLNDTHIVLIPKRKLVESMGDLRSISLCKVIYKIVAKAISNRLKRILLIVISNSQSAFIQGRAITDNILISFEVLHFLKRKTQGKRMLCLKWTWQKLMIARVE